MLVLAAADVRRALPMRTAIDAQKRAFAAVVNGRAEMPLRSAVTIPAEEAVMLVMPARADNTIGTKIVSVFPKNERRNLPRVHGVVLLLNAGTGQPEALIDATSLTALRTGAAAGVATELLAAPRAATAALIGTGAQATTLLLAICAVRPIDRVLIYSRDPKRVAAFIAAMATKVQPALKAAASPAEAVRDADIVCTATTSATPVFAGADLKPGAHVNGIGSFTPATQEVDTETIRRAGRVFVDCRAAALAEAGDVIVPLQAGVLAAADLIELGMVIAGRHPGRTTVEQITFFKSVGIAVQDMAAASEVLKCARELKLGVEVNL